MEFPSLVSTDIKKHLLCSKGGGVSIQSAPMAGSSYEIVVFPDGTRHFMMNGKTHDFGVILEEVEGTIIQAICVAERLRAVVAVMES